MLGQTQNDTLRASILCNIQIMYGHIFVKKKYQPQRNTCSQPVNPLKTAFNIFLIICLSYNKTNFPGLAGPAGGCLAKARRAGVSGPKGCGQDVRSRRPGHGWPVCRPRSPADQAAAQQPEAGPVSPSDRDADFHFLL